MASAEESPEPLKYQTWVLKIFIHCEGCKKKVKKVLQSIEGVYKTTIDSQQHKVTVTGNVEAETLIKKLLKSGKHAEPWPEKKPNNPNANGGGGGGGGKKNKNKNKNKDADASKPNESSETSDKSNQSAPDEDGDAAAAAEKPTSDPPKNGDKDHPKSDGKDSKPDKLANGSDTNKPAAEGAGSGAASGGGGGKKKGKKGPKENNGGGGGGGETAPEETGNVAALPHQQQGFQAAAPPSYVVSYTTAQPSLSYSYLYSSQIPAAGTYYIPAASAAPGSYDIFSEENANACSVM